MSSDQSRRQFLQASLALPAAAGFSSTTGGLNAVLQSPPKVEYRTLGKTGLKVSSVGYGIGFNPIPEVLLRAFDLGVTYYDTARAYADSEKVFAETMKGKRDKLVIATKSSQRTREAIMKDLDTSLSTLGTDRVDIWHLHGLDTWPNVPDEIVKTMEDCKKSGKARFIGFSCHDPNKMVDLVLKTKVFDVVQPTYSFAIGAYYRDDAIRRMSEAGVGISAMKVVVALSGLNLKSIDNPTARPNGDGPVAGIKWVLKNPAVGTTVPFMRTVAELEMNVRAMSEPYTDADEKLLFVLNEQIRPDYCRMCFSCSGVCPKGLPVADMLRFLAYNDFAGNFYQARSSYHDLAQEIRDVRCKDCSSCAIKCPNGVHVQSRLCRVQEILA